MRVSCGRSLRRSSNIALAAALALGFASSDWAQSPTVTRWGLFETAFTSPRSYENPLQDVELFVTFTSPSRQTQTVRGFWDGGSVWRVRFSPDQPGNWTYTTRAN